MQKIAISDRQKLFEYLQSNEIIGRKEVMKVYKKPEVRIERFTLSKHIAACAYDMSNLKDKENCVAVGDKEFNLGDMILFTNTTTGCKNTEFEYYCYENGSQGMNIFNS